jgi:hypothetical protein
VAALYEFGFAATAAVTNGWYWDMLATTSDAYVREIHMFAPAGTASAGTKLFRTTATGTRTTPTVPTALQCALSGAGNNPLAGFATAWSVNPTNATNAMRMWGGAASVGAGIIWTWYGPNGGLRVPAGSTIAVFNSSGATGPAFNVTVVWEE